MEESTDLYAILGVLPSAEDVVIRAAFRILSQRYHPDRYKGDPAEGAARMKRVEEAYAVLSDPARRRQYDQEAGIEAGADDGDKGRAENLLDAPGWRADWDVACRFYPALRDTEAQFRAMSPALAFTFCATLLETKRFPDGEGIARQLEQAYLGKSFGDNPEIIAFAKRLIVAGNNEAVRTLRQALRVLGSSTPASVIIETLNRDFLQAPAGGAREPESEPEPEPAASDSSAGESGPEETPSDVATEEEPTAEEAAAEEPVAEAATAEEPASEEPPVEAPAAESAAPEAPAGEETIELAPAIAVEEEPAPAEPEEEAEVVAEARAPEPEPTPEPETVAPPAEQEPVVAKGPPPPQPMPEPAPAATAKPGAKQAPVAKHVFKDAKKRASAQNIIRACRAGEDLDLDSAATLVRSMDGVVNLKRADAQLGDVRVEVKFRGQNIMFSSSEFVEWAKRKILPEARASV